MLASLEHPQSSLSERRLLTVALLGEHPDEGTHRMAEAINERYGRTGVAALVLNEAAALEGRRWTNGGVNMAHVSLPADTASPHYEVRRVAEVDQYIAGVRQNLGYRPISLLLVNVHTSPYPGNTAVYAGDGDEYTRSLAWQLGVNKLIVADFPNVTRWGYDRRYDVKNLLLDISEDHPLHGNSALLADSLGAIATGGLPACQNTITEDYLKVQRFLHHDTVREDRARELGVPMYGPFERISDEHAAALGYRPKTAFYAVTWGDHFPGIRGEVVRRI
jgi:hypothetical protein